MMGTTSYKPVPEEGITPHSFFIWDEFCYSRTAVDNDLDNTPPAEAQESIKHLVTQLLDPLRMAYNKPIRVTSGYRSPEVNRRVGGSNHSQHLKGEAADLYIPEGPQHLLDVLLLMGFPFDQAIVYGVKRVLHLSLRHNGVNRRSVSYYLKNS